MGELDVEVARTLTELLRTQNLELTETIRNSDDQIDELHISVFEKVLSDSWSGEAGATVDATLASRYHERFADHAVNVAKKVVYLATGDWNPDTDTIAIITEQSGSAGAAQDTATTSEESSQAGL
jgi:phosphate transport system protein